MIGSSDQRMRDLCLGESERSKWCVTMKLELQMAATGNQDMTAGEHTGFIARQKRDRAGDESDMMTGSHILITGGSHLQL